MFKRIFPLLLSLVLCGCAAQNPPMETSPTECPVPEEAPVGLSFQELPDSIGSDGALTAYSLSGGEISGILPFGQGFLLVSEQEGGCVLTAASGSDPADTSSLVLDFELTEQDCALHNNGKMVSYFDPAAMQTVVLNESLQELYRIDAPEDLMGAPLLSEDCGTLYYCTSDSIRAFDMNSGISRLVKAVAYPFQTVSGLLLNDSVLQVEISENGENRTLFLSADTGARLANRADHPVIVTSGTVYGAKLPAGTGELLLFGDAAEAPKVLTPRYPEGRSFFPGGSSAVITAFSPEADQTILDLYDLRSGLRTASLTTAQELAPDHFCCAPDGTVWFAAHHPEHGGQMLFRWDPAASSVEESELCADTYYTRKAPDLEGLESCRVYAQQLTEKYGIEILIYEDAVQTQPGDYILESEFLVPVIRRQLELLEDSLGNYPEGFLRTLAGEFTALKICIVQQIAPAPGSGNQASLSRLRFWDGYDARIVLTSGENVEFSLYHELCQLLETPVLTRSIAYDQWELLNPAEFAYDPGYAADPAMDGSVWMREGQESFLNETAMASPAEDRAQIMAFAMTQGNDHRFQSPYLQAKLSRLCAGIREAFGLKDHTAPLLWEQYLTVPLE